MNENGLDDRSDEEENSPTSGNVNKVKQNWQVFEDFGLAYKMQNAEFSNHYDKNRSERRLMHKDIRLTKEEQKSEDSFAAAYYEQLRLDQEKEDARLALEMQKQLEDEERRARAADEQEDQILAERLQSLEMAGKQSSVREKPSSIGFADLKSASRRLDANLAESNARMSDPFAITKSPSGDRLVLPPGLTSDLLTALEQAKGGEPVVLPPGFTREQHRSVQEAAIEEDRRLAEEIQDYELARFVASKEKPIAANNVKPSELLALTKGSGSEASRTISNPGTEYSEISKKPKKSLTHGSSSKR